MTFVAVPNAAKCVVTFSVPDGGFSNTLWFTKLLFDDNDQDTLLSTVAAGWGQGMKTYMSDQAAYVDTTVYDMRSSIGRIVNSTTGFGPGSISTGDALPGGDALVITLRTANRGRSGRGRLYVGGLSESQYTLGAFDGTTATNINNTLASTVVAAAVAGWSFVVVSRQLDGAVRTPPVTQAVTSHSIRTLVPGSQRRRNHRH